MTNQIDENLLECVDNDEHKLQTPGVMHACGHDGHVAIGLGTATLLQRHREELAGTVKLVFQPGEEGLNGAEAMVEEGAIEDYGPRPEAAFGLHLWNLLPLGKAGVTAGPVMAAADRWSLIVKGQGGHGALPHQTTDPITATAQLIGALQTIVSRNVSPLKTAVVSVGSINGGTAFNVIPNEVKLVGTVRTFESEVRETVVNRMQTLCQGIASAMDVQIDLNVAMLVPAVVNDATATELLQPITEAILGQGSVRSDYRTMVSEDMAFFLQEVPGCFMYLGSANAERGLDYGHHNPHFDFDEAALPLGAAILSEVATRFLNRIT